jgi:hypothetical protein
MPDEIASTTFYHPGQNKQESDIDKRLTSWWGEKYKP